MAGLFCYILKAEPSTNYDAFGIPPLPFGKPNDKRNEMQKINTTFQRQAANIIAELLNENVLCIKPSVFNYSDDKKILLFQICSNTNGQEICILQQIIYPNNTKSVNIYFNGHAKNWDSDVIKYLIDVVSAKSQKQ